MDGLKQKSEKLRFVAHRGGLYYRPENTLAAVEYISGQGIDWVECDVRISRDGIPVVFHDERFQAPGRGNQEIRELDAQVLSTIDVGGGELLPTVRVLLERFGGKLNFDLDIKVLDAVDKVVALIREFGLERRVIISSFYVEALQRSQELAPEIARGFLLDRLTGRLVNGRAAVRAACLLECEYFLPHFKILKPEWAKAARSKGVKVIPWTVNQVSDAQRLIEFGIDGFISDRPDWLKAQLASSLSFPSDFKE